MAGTAAFAAVALYASGLYAQDSFFYRHVNPAPSPAPSAKEPSSVPPTPGTTTTQPRKLELSVQNQTLRSRIGGHVSTGEALVRNAKGPVSFSMPGLPNGLGLDKGSVYGQPTNAQQTTTYTLSVSDGSETATAPFFLTVDPALVVGPAGARAVRTRVGKAMPGLAYTVGGSIGEVTWTSESDGHVPAGIVAQGGTIHGSPTESGEATLRLTATDAHDGMSATTDPVTVVVDPLLTVSGLPADGRTSLYQGPAMAPISLGLDGSPVAPLAWQVVSGAFPAGVALDPATGTISGSPNASGTFEVGIKGRDAAGDEAAVKSLSVTVPPAPSFGYPAPVGKAFVPLNLVPSTADAATPSFALASGDLPPGTRLGADGAITGTPSKAGRFEARLRLTDAETGSFSEKDLAVDVAAAGSVATAFPSGVAVDGTGRPDAVASLYDNSLDSTWYSGRNVILSFPEPLTASALLFSSMNTLQWTLDYLDPEDGATWKRAGAGSSGNYRDAVASFPAVAASSWRVNVTGTIQKLRLLDGGASPVAPGTAPVPVQSLMLDAPYTLALSPVDAVGPVSFAQVSGTLPDGLRFLPDGTVSGTPTKAGSFGASFTATDSRMASASRFVSFSVRPSATAATELPASLSTKGGVAFTDAFGASLPVWIGATYDGLTGTKATMPSGSSMTYAFAKPIRADQVLLGCTGTGSVTIGALDLINRRNVEQSVTCGSGPAAVRTFPSEVSAAEFSVYPSGGNVALTTAVLGHSSVTPSRQQTPSLAVASALTTIPANTDAEYTAASPLHKLAFADVVGAPSFAVEGALPPGLGIDATGALVGKATAFGSYAFSVRVSDSRGVPSAPARFQVDVRSALLASSTFPSSIVVPAGTVTTNAFGTQVTPTVSMLQDGVTTAQQAFMAVPAGGSFELVYDKPVRLNGLSAFAKGSTYQYITAQYLDAKTDAYVTIKSYWSGSAEQAIDVDTTRIRFTNATSAVAYFAEAKALFDYAAPTAPSLAAPTAAVKPILGTTYTAASPAATLTAANASAPATYAVVGGALPEGLSIDASGKIVGSATSLGQRTAFVQVRDGRGLESSPVEVRFEPHSSVSASTRLPSVTTSGTVYGSDSSRYAASYALAALYDGVGTYVSTARGQTVEFNYAEPVRANGARMDCSGQQLSYLPPGGSSWVAIADNACGTLSFDVTASSFRLTTTSASGEIRSAALQYGGVAAPYAPGIALASPPDRRNGGADQYGGVYLLPVAGQDYPNLYAFAARNVTGQAQYAVVAGSLLPDVTLTPDGMVSTVSTGTAASKAAVGLTDASGIAAVPMALGIIPTSNVLAANTLPNATSPAVYMRDAYDANLSSTYRADIDPTEWFRYSQDVTADSFTIYADNPNRDETVTLEMQNSSGQFQYLCRVTILARKSGNYSCSFVRAMFSTYRIKTRTSSAYLGSARVGTGDVFPTYQGP